MEMRRSIDLAMDRVAGIFETVEDEFESIFGRRYGSIETVGCEDADIVLVTTGSATATSRLVVEKLRGQGEKVGLLKLKRFRPFPTEAIRRALAGVHKVAVLDRNFCFGVGGIFAQEIRAALYGLDDAPVMFNYIAGLGGRDIPPDLIEAICATTKNNAAPAEKSIWVGLNEELLESCSH
jgi:pyruvate/2-oxoacid:ferredoxin oxidoreductase alpha subunit